MQYSTEWIRKAFLSFFLRRSHKQVPSSPLVPSNDPTLLFTNAGMNQFKAFFLGTKTSPYPCAVTVQRCLRAGGKHNDLENVGYTARHQTFFEMLGNFSFGAYFKKEAIAYAWEFLTGPDSLSIPAERLWVTVYKEDTETYAIWREMLGLPEERIIRIGDKPGQPQVSDNFWQMGETGPCGPSTEIFYDYGPAYAGQPPGAEDETGERFIEIWNLVFMQFDRQADGTLLTLPKPCVDTGMGLERIAAVLQGCHANYEIDLFKQLISRAAELLQIKSETKNASLRVIADHSRAAAFLIGEGICPANEGRGYVLRRIIRRAVRHGQKLGATGPFLSELIPTVVAVMGSTGAALGAQLENIKKIIHQEEILFFKTLCRGLTLLNQAIAGSSGTTLMGDLAFSLYDTYGFPLDLTEVVCREHGMTVDIDGFSREMAQQRQRAKQSSQFKNKFSLPRGVPEVETKFFGYDTVQGEAMLLQGLSLEGASVTGWGVGEQGYLILDKTVFYPEAGGQLGDKGTLVSLTGAFAVEDTVRIDHLILHRGQVISGRFEMGAVLSMQVDSDRRRGLRDHHSASHLLHAALRMELGGAVVTQKGSLVASDLLRFDFSSPQALSRTQLSSLETRINDLICAALPVHTQICTLSEAKEQGALAVFTERYADTVRVVSMGEVSKELCGGTHVRNTGELGFFRILSESSIALGVRRIEACVGAPAVRHAQAEREDLLQIQTLLKADRQTIIQQLEKLFERQQILEKKNQALNQQILRHELTRIRKGVKQRHAFSLIVDSILVDDKRALRIAADSLQRELSDGVVVLVGQQAEVCHVVASVSTALSLQVDAKKIIQCVVSHWGGKGGGTASFAQATCRPVKAPLPDLINQLCEQLHGALASI